MACPIKWAQVCRIISKPSSFLGVIICTAALCSIGSHASTSLPSIFPAKVFRARPGPMAVATSSTVLACGNSRCEPSGRVTVIKFRFGLFALAVCFLLEENKNELKYFFLSLCLVLLVLFFDSVFQKIFGINLIGIKMHHAIRVSSFFADELILGSYIIKILPITLSFLYFLYGDRGDKYSIIFILIALVLVLLSAEKASFFMIILFSLLFFPTLNFSKKLKGFIIFIFFLIIGSVILLNKPIQKRLYHQLISQSGGGKYMYSRVHHSHFKTAYKMFLDKPLFGHGPKMYRFKCSDKKYMEDQFACSTHPHNYILQILAETGIVGVLFLFLLYINIFIVFIKNLKISKLFKKFSYTEYIIASSLLVIFFPLATSGSIFNNWTSCVNFLTIGILMYFIQSNKKKRLP